MNGKYHLCILFLFFIPDSFDFLITPFWFSTKLSWKIQSESFTSFHKLTNISIELETNPPKNWKQIPQKIHRVDEQKEEQLSNLSNSCFNGISPLARLQITVHQTQAVLLETERFLGHFGRQVDFATLTWNHLHQDTHFSSSLLRWCKITHRRTAHRDPIKNTDVHRNSVRNVNDFEAVLQQESVGCGFDISAEKLRRVIRLFGEIFA